MRPTIRADPLAVVMVTGQSRSGSRGQSADQSGDAEVRFFVLSQVLERLIADTESSVKVKLWKGPSLDSGIATYTTCLLLADCGMHFQPKHDHPVSAVF